MSAPEHRHQRRMAAQLSALMDGDVGRLQGLFLRRHIARCAGCQETLRGLEQQRAALRGLPGPDEAPGLECFWQVRARLLADGRPRWRAPLGLRAAGAGALGVLAVAALVRLRPAGILPRPVDEDRLIRRAEERFSEAERPYQEALQLLERRRQDPGAQPRLRELRVRTAAAQERARSRPADAGAQALLYQAYRDEIANLLGGR